MNDDEKRDLQRQALQKELDQLIERAKNNGFVITVDTKPGEPLAMGNYVMHGEVRDWAIHAGRVQP